MRRLILFAVTLPLLCCPIVLGQQVTLDHVVGLIEPDTLLTNRQIIFYLRFTNNYTDYVWGSTNGFVLKSPDGAVWSPAIAEPTGAITTDMYDGGVFVNKSSWDGIAADTVGFGGFKMLKPGIPSGFDEVVFTFETHFDENQSGKHFSLDTAFYQPAGTWLWSSVENLLPSWDGSHDYVIAEANVGEFVWENCPEELTFDHCQMATYDFDAYLLSTEQEQRPVTFGLIDGPGTIDSITGVWTLAPDMSMVMEDIELVVEIYDEYLPGPPCFVDLNFTNIAPTFFNGCNADVKTTPGNTTFLQMTATSGDCDPIAFKIVSVNPTPAGDMAINPSDGMITFTPDPADAGDSSQFFDIEVMVTDGLDTSLCHTGITVVNVNAFAIEIERTHRSMLGAEETVAITFRDGSLAIGGFDFLIAYDASALGFNGAAKGNIFDDYGWEYFTYRTGEYIDCNGDCPSGLLRVVGMAETNNGPVHPNNLFLQPDDIFTTMSFIVSSSPVFECLYIPIRFFWTDCTDNSLAFYDLEDTEFQLPIQGISRFVYDGELIGDITNPDTGYPTYTGAQDEDCFVGGPGDLPMRMVDYFNGGVEIICADAIDSRGDVNLNGVAYEIADAVLFASYFLHGTSVFTISLDNQISATDVNADCVYLSVADLVYLIRVIVGEAVPYPRLVSTSTTYTFDNGRLSIDSDVGAGYFVVAGEVVPTLLAENMDMQYNFDGVNTRILVYSMESGASFSGDVLSINGELINMELATYEGAPMTAKEVPSSYELRQNYPNPFNATTSISFNMPRAGDYELTIYNVQGQQVTHYANRAEVGTVTIDWDASAYASGVYFYRLTVGEFTDTRKMVLLK